MGVWKSERTVRNYRLEVIHDYIIRRLTGFSDRVALHEWETGRTLTFAQLHSAIYKVAGNLQLHGLRKGDLLLVQLPNCIEYVITCYATALAGGIFTSISAQSTADETLRIVEDCKPCIYITAEGNFASVMRLLSMETFAHLIVFMTECTALDIPGIYCYDRLFQDMESVAFPAMNLEDPANVTYSSGTTGMPKGVVMSHRAVVSTVEILKDSHYEPFTAGETVVCAMAIYNGYSQHAVMHLSMKQGATMVIVRKYSFSKLLEVVEKCSVKQLHIVPVIGLFLASSMEVLQYDLSSLEIIVSSGSYFGPELQKKIFARFPHIRYVRQVYGLTESGPTAITTEKDRLIPGSVGRLAPYVELKILESGSNAEACSNVLGEIWMRTSTVMSEYLNRPVETSDTMTKDRWIRSGDIGFMDKEGNLFVVDRIKELIKYKGNQIAPAELEFVLQTHPDVFDVAVVGVPHPVAGEVPRAFVVRKSGSTVSEDELCQFLKDKVSPFKWLRGGIEFIDTIPRSENAKILRRVLKTKTPRNEWEL